MGVLTHYETLHTKDILHGFHKRDASTQEKVVEKVELLISIIIPC